MKENPYEPPKNVEQGEPHESIDLRLDRFLRKVSKVIAWPLAILVSIVLALELLSFLKSAFFPPQ